MLISSYDKVFCGEISVSGKNMSSRGKSYLENFPKKQLKTSLISTRIHQLANTWTFQQQKFGSASSNRIHSFEVQQLFRPFKAPKGDVFQLSLVILVQICNCFFFHFVPCNFLFFCCVAYQCLGWDFCHVACD